MAWQKSHLFYSKKLPSPHRWGHGTVLIYDRILTKNVDFARWIRKFDLKYGVKSGEKLKNLDQFPKHMKKIVELVEGQPLQEITIVVFGGGSLGDFAGFVASVLKRGVRLVQIPSTWLSAVDSAHGGKTALNISKIKNQIGTFYSAEEVFLVREVLEALPHVRSVEALGEILKINLIEGRQLWKNMMHLSKVDSQSYWKHLPLLVDAKYRIVKKDPFEKKGIRYLLNLGHTMGHVWESQLKIPHGIAVLYGVAFALEWSLHRKILSSKEYYNIRLSEFGSFLPDRIDREKIIQQTKNPKKFLLQDKKISAHSEIRFVFLTAPGKACIQKVTINELLNELKRQAI